MKDVNEVPTERSIRRWPWVIVLLLAIAGVAGAAGVLRDRRLPRRAPERLEIRPVEQPTLRYREQVATGRSPTGNGVVRTERPSTGPE